MGYRGLFPGIDLICYGSAGSFEYDFEVMAGADPSRIGFSLGETYTARVERNGDLVVSGRGREWRHRAPRVYQGTRAISTRYVLRADGGFGFEYVYCDLGSVVAGCVGRTRHAAWRG